MKRFIGRVLCAMLICSMLTACSGGGQTPDTSSDVVSNTDYLVGLLPDSITINDIMVPSREMEIPATITLPKGSGDERVPLVVMHHGHGGSRSENGGFDDIAMALAERGIASIRMDFSGCGDSTETFRDNCIFNMTIDSNASLAYALANFPIDADKLGIFGYSMGGRVALDIGTLKDAPYKAIGLLAPSADPGTEMMVRMFGSQDEFDKHYAEAFSEKRYTVYTTQYGQVQELSTSWFADMEMSQPLKNMPAYTGDVLVIYGDKDDVVPTEVSLSVIEAATSAPSKSSIVLEGADHGYGFYDDNTDIKDQVADEISAFFYEKLK